MLDMHSIMEELLTAAKIMGSGQIFKGQKLDSLSLSVSVSIPPFPSSPRVCVHIHSHARSGIGTLSHCV